MRLVLLISLNLLVSSFAFAKDGKFTHIDTGEEAPFDGTLFDPVATAKILTNKEFCEEEVELKLNLNYEKLEKEANLKLKILETELNASKEKSKELLLLKDEEIEKLRKQAANQKVDLVPIIAAGGGSLLAGIIIGLLVIN